jgi:polar amino acid transport system permease protein
LTAILGGAWVAFYLLAATALGGTGLSILGAIAQRSSFAFFRYFVSAYVELFRNTPFLAQLFLVFFGLPSIGVKLNTIEAAILAMTLNYAAYGTAIVAGGINAVPESQFEAGFALGLRPFISFLKIILPQALKVIYPALASQTVIMLLETAAVSQISVPELTYQADLIQARTFRSFDVYLVVTLVYLSMGIVLRKLLNKGRVFILG